MRINNQDRKTYKSFFDKISGTVSSLLSENLPDSAMYCEGEICEHHHISMDNYECDSGSIYKAGDYENIVRAKILSNNLCIIVGGVGHGKTTMINHVLNNINISYKYAHQYYSILQNIDYLETSKSLVDVFRLFRLELYDRIIESIDVGYLGERNENIRALSRAVLVAKEVLGGGQCHLRNARKIGNVRELMDINDMEDFIHNIRHMSASEVEKWMVHSDRLYDNIENYLKEDLNEDNNLKNSKHLTKNTILVMQHIAQKQNKKPVLIVDNIDQDRIYRVNAFIISITQIVNKINAKSDNPIPCIILTRPGTLYTKYYSDNRENLVDHKAPYPTTVVVRRLDKGILELSRDKIMSNFNIDDTDIYESLIVVTKYIKKVLTAGDYSEATTHPDHAEIKIQPKNRDNISSATEVLRCMCGISSRSLLEIVKQMYKEMYYEPDVLVNTINKNNKTVECIVMTYSQMMRYIFRYGSRAKKHIYNIYSDKYKFRGVTTVGIRILKRLNSVSNDMLFNGDNSIKIHDLIKMNAQYGIAIQETLDNLMDMAKPENRLVWYSNDGISEDYKYNENERVAISRKGIQHYNKLICEFEYLWYCQSCIVDEQKAKNMEMASKVAAFSSILLSLSEREYSEAKYRSYSKEANINIGKEDNESGITSWITTKSIGKMMCAVKNAIEGDAELKRRDKSEQSDIVRYKREIIYELIKSINTIAYVYRKMYRYYNVEKVVVHNNKYYSQLYGAMTVLDVLQPTVERNIPDPSLYRNARRNLEEALDEIRLDERKITEKGQCTRYLAVLADLARVPTKQASDKQLIVYNKDRVERTMHRIIEKTTSKAFSYRKILKAYGEALQRYQALHDSMQKSPIGETDEMRVLEEIIEDLEQFVSTLKENEYSLECIEYQDIESNKRIQDVIEEAVRKQINDLGIETIDHYSEESRYI